MKTYEHILYHVSSGILTLTINRPEVYNAMNRSTKLELIEAIREGNADASINVIILTGQGKAFSSGQDLQDRTVKAGKDQKEPVDLGHTLATEWNPLIKAIRDSHKIVIGAINGVCAGAGLSVALACDLLVAKPQVKFVSGFVQIGLCPDAGSSFALVRTLGYQRALGFSFMGMPLMSEDLLAAGLINTIAEDEKKEAQLLAEKVNALPPLAVRAVKENFQAALNSSFQDSMEREMVTQRALGKSLDYQEGLAAFFEKRKPVFQGK